MSISQIGVFEAVNQLGNEIINEVAIEDINITPGVVGEIAGNVTTKPVLYDSSSGNFVKPNNPLFKTVLVNTPVATGEPVLVQDADGNDFDINEWTAIVASFFNIAGDRTYGCQVFKGASKWFVQYDQASSTQGFVTVLLISNYLFINRFT